MSAVKLLAILLCVFEVNSMALKGSPLTRYDPCGLGVIHFDKITEKFWKGVVNLGLYTNLKSDVTMEINFEKKVTINGASLKTNVTVANDSHDFKFKIDGAVPFRYTFYMKLSDNETDVPTVKTFLLNNYSLCDDAIKASQTIESLNRTDAETYYRHVCGRKSLSHAELTTVQAESLAGDWPWHVAILNRNLTTNTTSYQCGGNIISRTAIVTAGHCVKKWGDPKELLIVAGVNNHKDVNQIGRQEMFAEQVIVHPNYEWVQATSDLAVIKVNRLRFTEYVQPICIWGPVYDKTNLFGYQATVMVSEDDVRGRMYLSSMKPSFHRVWSGPILDSVWLARVVGFGRTEYNMPTDVLRSTYTMVQNDSTCINYDRTVYEPLLNEFTFCAGYGPDVGINPRNGDSGGGLVVPTMQPDHKLSWFLRGVLSKCGVPKGETYCDPRFYMVYTDVGPHYGWLYHHSGLQFGNNIKQ